MLQERLPIELVREVFTYDDTYKDTYQRIVKDAFDGERVRALKTLLDSRVYFPMVTPTQWITMTALMDNGHKYYQVHYPGFKFLFHVASLDDEPKQDNWNEPGSPNVYEKRFCDIVEKQMGPYENNKTNLYKTSWYKGKMYIIMCYQMMSTT